MTNIATGSWMVGQRGACRGEDNRKVRKEGKRRRQGGMKGWLERKKNRRTVKVRESLYLSKEVRVLYFWGFKDQDIQIKAVGRDKERETERERERERERPTNRQTDKEQTAIEIPWIQSRKE